MLTVPSRLLVAALSPDYYSLITHHSTVAQFDYESIRFQRRKLSLSGGNDGHLLIFFVVVPSYRLRSIFTLKSARVAGIPVATDLRSLSRLVKSSSLVRLHSIRGRKDAYPSPSYHCWDHIVGQRRDRFQKGESWDEPRTRERLVERRMRDANLARKMSEVIESWLGIVMRRIRPDVDIRNITNYSSYTTLTSHPTSTLSLHPILPPSAPLIPVKPSRSHRQTNQPMPVHPLFARERRNCVDAVVAGQRITNYARLYCHIARSWKCPLPLRYPCLQIKSCKMATTCRCLRSDA
jgi:hypothetical protein